MQIQAVQAGMQNLVVSTAYSGAGFFEGAVAHLGEVLGVGLNDRACFLQAFDIDETCRLVLCSHRHSPKHVFSDLRRLFPDECIRKMQTIQERLEETLEEEVAGGADRRSVTDLLGRQEVEMLYACVQDEPMEMSQWCSKCEKLCNIEIPGKESFHIIGAGSTCVDYSSMSSRALRMCGQHMIPFTAWITSVQIMGPQIVVHECVAQHPSALLFSRYLGHDYNTYSDVLCPSKLGFPCTRRRRYTVCVRKSVVAASPQGELVNPLEMLCRKFFAKQGATGVLYWRADPCEVKAVLEKLGPSSFKAALKAGDAKRLAEYEECVTASAKTTHSRASQDQAAQAHLLDLGQTCSWAGGTRETVGCLLRRSKWWSITHERWLLGSEALGLMGFWSLANPFQALVTDGRLTESELWSLSGNGMHAPSVCALLISIFVSVETAEPCADTSSSADGQGHASCLKKMALQGRERQYELLKSSEESFSLAT